MAFGAVRRLEFGRVFQLFEVVFIRPIIDVHLSLDTFATLLAGFPIPRVFFFVMMTADRVPAVVAMAAISGIREQLVFMLVIANPLPAAFRPGQVFCIAAQSALWFFRGIFFDLTFSLFIHFFSVIKLRRFIRFAQ